MKIGIIGGTGLDDPNILHNRTEVKFDGSGVGAAANGKVADYGQPSDVLITGERATPEQYTRRPARAC